MGEEENIDIDIDIDKDILENIDIDIDIEKDILENIDIDIDIDKDILENIDIDKEILENIDIDIDIDKDILEDIDIDIDKEILENIDIDKEILENIDIDKISNRLEFGISNRAIPTSSPSSSICPASSLISDAASQMRFILHCSLLIFCFSLNLSAMSPESWIFNCLIIQQFLCCVVIEKLRGSSLLFVQLRSEPSKT